MFAAFNRIDKDEKTDADSVHVLCDQPCIWNDKPVNISGLNLFVESGENSEKYCKIFSSCKT